MLYNYFRFVNWQADAIHIADPDALVTVGVWNPVVNIYAFGFHDLFSDLCLLTAGGRRKVSYLTLISMCDINI